VPTRTDRRPLQPRSLIVTVYGLYARDVGGWLSVAALIRLLAELGVDAPAVRSSVSRLKRRGIVEAARVAGAAGYGLSQPARDLLAQGDQRIFRQSRPTIAEGWLLAVFSVPDEERRHRYLLRASLGSLGFAGVAPGVWVAPAHLHEEAVSTLRRAGLTPYVELFRADHLAFGDLPVMVRRWWDLDRLAALYREFVAVHAPLVRRWQRRNGRHDAAAFADWVRALTVWRRLPYLDPGVPVEPLPAGWPGDAATDVLHRLREQLDFPARRHVFDVLGR
jgi:phenylacetic acid degradation operon negative regulatory protein